MNISFQLKQLILGIKPIPHEAKNEFFVDGSRWRLTKRYHPIEHIATGGNSTVILALDQKKKKHVAVKQIPVMNDASLYYDSVRELLAMWYLRDSEHAVSILGLETDWDSSGHLEHIYVVMKYFPMDLRLYIDEYGNELDVKDVMGRIVRAIAEMGIKHGMVHRDLKPGNILVDFDDDGKLSEVKLADFGSVFFLPHSTLTTGNRVGLAKYESKMTDPLTSYITTTNYRAPEILSCPNDYIIFPVDVNERLDLKEKYLNGEDISARNWFCNALDLWSLGCIYEQLDPTKRVYPGLMKILHDENPERDLIKVMYLTIL